MRAFLILWLGGYTQKEYRDRWMLEYKAGREVILKQSQEIVNLTKAHDRPKLIRKR